jgi:hypothetical protein
LLAAEIFEFTAKVLSDSLSAGMATLGCPINGGADIPIGTTHRLENPGKFNLELIEVQSGSYLEENDIVRIEDTYGRVEVKA